MTAATVTAQATADARGAQAGPPRRDGTPQATSPRLVREPEPGPDTPAGPPPAFEISILERERAVQALLARGTGNADPDAPAAPDGPTSAPSRPPARHLAADASIG